MIVTFADALNVVRIQRGQRWILIGIVGCHPHDDTVFQSPGNLGIIAR
jgi:hypothetical protein